MTELIKKTLETLCRQGEGDMVDRLSSTTTVSLLIVLAVLVSAKQYVGQPIQCWVPAELTNSMEQYVENYCYIQNTYFLPYDLPIKHQNVYPTGRNQRKKTSIEKTSNRTKSDPIVPKRIVGYYQWVPYILSLQAFFYYAPRIVWQLLSSLSGIHFYGMITLALRCLLCGEREKMDIRYLDLVDYVRCALDLNRASRRRSSRWNVFGRRGSCFLVAAFLLMKALYVANAIGQIFFLNFILQTGDPLFGINLARNLSNGIEWQQSGVFPRSTMCEVEIREVFSGNLHSYVIQCVLMVNLFNERLFVFLWFWSIFICIISSANLLYWILSMCLPGVRRRFVRRLLPELPMSKNAPEANELSNFVDNYLSVDGVFLLRIIHDQIGAITTSRVTTYLWQDFLRDQR